MSQSMKTTSTKIKRSTKERDKRKSFGNQDGNINTSEKNSPSKENQSKRYAGLTTENIKVAAEHVTFPELITEDSLKLLTEDLNYKLRYIIHQAANRAFVSNRTGINGTDIEETFEDLQLDKIYGATSEPCWIPLPEQNYLILDDSKVNLIEESEKEISYSQPLNPLVEKTWLPETDAPNHSLKNYFKALCEAVVCNDIEVRKMALQNISSNPYIGPIINWFYRFGYVLLSKDVTYDSLTFYALDLIETLEMSPLGNSEADENQLKLLVRLLLQRLLKTQTNTNVLKPMCWVLAILCRRYTIKEFVLAKLKQKIPDLTSQYLLPFLMLVNSIGTEAIIDLFLKIFVEIHTKFKSEIEEENIINGCGYNIFNSPKLSFDYQLHGYTLMETFYILFQNDILDRNLEHLPELYHFNILLSKPQELSAPQEMFAGMDFINMKKQLIKTRRKLEASQHGKMLSYDSIFEIPTYRTRMKQKIENHYKTNYHMSWKKQTHVVIGKTSLLLPVMKNINSTLPQCYDHSLFSLSTSKG